MTKPRGYKAWTPTERKIYLTLGGVIRYARTNAGLSQADLAARVGLSRTSIANIENGHQKPLIDTLVWIGHHLSLKTSEILRACEDCWR